MGVVDELVRARADFERGEWAAALERWSSLDPDGLTPTDLESAGSAAQLLGRPSDAVDRYRRAFEEHVAAGERERAARCAFHLSMVPRTTSDHATASGWLARGERIVAELPEGSLEGGYLAFSRMCVHPGRGDFAAARDCAERATEAGRRHGDHGLVAVGLCAQGRMDIYSGRIAAGISLLDESMLEATSRTLEPILLGNVYCTAIEGCQEVSDLRRVEEWTQVLQSWCEQQPGLVTFTGQCALHRGQVMVARGAWDEAAEELSAAIDRYRLAGAFPAIGQAATELGDLRRLRGDLAGAADAYGLSAEQGHDPQPGSALLWLASGAAASAEGAARRLLAETHTAVGRTRVLPGVLAVLLAVGDVETARGCAAELDAYARSFGSDVLAARAAYAGGLVELSAGDAAGALPYLRRAQQSWVALDVPYEAALAQAAIGRALLVLGDGESARRALASARQVFVSVGASPDADAVDATDAIDANDANDAVTVGDGAAGRAPRPAGLSEREVEVLRLVAAGLSNAQIAADLVLSDRTVARHLSNIFTKLGVGSRTAAAAFAFEHHLL
ncbi:MAG: LuxR C-terminal-related transcriptional regulator [Terrabacter sp.]